MIPTHITERLQVFADARFVFDPGPHEYQLATRKLTSWSKWIERYTKPFPEAEAAAASARKRGCTSEEILAEWDWSRELGTLVHTWIEQWYQNAGLAKEGGYMPLPTHPDVCARCQKFLAIYNERLHTMWPVAMELQTFHEQAGVAGTIDFIGHHPQRQGVIVADWKTNSKFTLNSQVGRYTDRMLGPLADLWDTKENLYSLQNSFYRILLEEAGIPTATGAMVHLPPGDAPAVIYPATDYRTRIRSILF